MYKVFCTGNAVEKEEEHNVQYVADVLETVRWALGDGFTYITVFNSEAVENDQRKRLAQDVP